MYVYFVLRKNHLIIENEMTGSRRLDNVTFARLFESNASTNNKERDLGSSLFQETADGNRHVKNVSSDATTNYEKGKTENLVVFEN